MTDVVIKNLLVKVREQCPVFCMRRSRYQLLVAVILFHDGLSDLIVDLIDVFSCLLTTHLYTEMLLPDVHLKNNQVAYKSLREENGVI